MPRNVYSEINLHIVWRTKASAPVLTEQIEARAHNHIKHAVLNSEGCLFREIGGTENHIHLVVSVPSTLLISEWVGKLKGASSHYINKEIANRKFLEWQTGYGVVSFGSRDLPWVIEYVRNQRQHHKRGSTYDRLERIERKVAEAEQGKHAEAR
ncbi:MAG TPA: IS200/IS605 family transposase [Blastocatellia bacterium]|nr:IS200/IS605 family transposase [Blastocatellia bacterium]